MMRLKKSHPDAPRYSEGLRTRLRDSTRRPQDERISESAKAISIEMITVLSSNTEIVQAPARPNVTGAQLRRLLGIVPQTKGRSPPDATPASIE